ncbi:MAG: sugar-binding protein, partial [Armatimonadota bacterium]
MRQLALTIVVAALAGSAAAGSLVPDPTLFCPPAGAGIAINGVLEEVVWQIPALVPKFVGIDGKDPQEQTEAWAAFGKDGIYFAFSCRQAKMSPTNSVTNPQPWRDDSVELFIDANGDRATYHHFILSAAGAKFYERVGGSSALGANMPAEWEGVARIEEGKWFAEVYIPYSTLGKRLEEGMVIRANLCR